MDWETRLNAYQGHKLEVIIEDVAGTDPLAPATARTLHRVRLTEEQTHLQFYFNETQFLAIPVYDDDRTQLEQSGAETVFSSRDESAKLIYKLRIRS